MKQPVAAPAPAAPEPDLLGGGGMDMFSAPAQPTNQVDSFDAFTAQPSQPQAVQPQQQSVMPQAQQQWQTAPSQPVSMPVQSQQTTGSMDQWGQPAVAAFPSNDFNNFMTVQPPQQPMSWPTQPKAPEPMQQMTQMSAAVPSQPVAVQQDLEGFGSFTQSAQRPATGPMQALPQYADKTQSEPPKEPAQPELLSGTSGLVDLSSLNLNGSAKHKSDKSGNSSAKHTEFSHGDSFKGLDGFSKPNPANAIGGQQSQANMQARHMSSQPPMNQMGMQQPMGMQQQPMGMMQQPMGMPQQQMGMPQQYPQMGMGVPQQQMGMPQQYPQMGMGVPQQYPQMGMMQQQMGMQQQAGMQQQNMGFGSFS